jgi:predicted short-subunit dehydrogenase-like oxidoreductase (DUF2520 family)
MTPRLHPGQPRELSIGVLGAGRLGSALAAALAAAGYGGIAVASSRHERAEALAGEIEALEATEPAALVERADLVVLAVPDAQVAAVAASLPWRAGLAAVHCSGALGLDVLEPARRQGTLPGCLHPLQTFPSGESPSEAASRFRGITCGVEGAAPLGSLLERIVRDLGATPVRLEGVDRALYHAAAVLVSNDVVALAAAAQRTWALAGLPPAGAREALGPLLLAAASNAARQSPEEALTGPVARGDVPIVERHLRALEADPELRDLYRRLALELLRLDLGHPPEVAERLRENLTLRP